ncbi:MAG: hypothetical protein RIQ62_773 [Bacteroidota bacterium]|jgi:hypothetical protein
MKKLLFAFAVLCVTSHVHAQEKEPIRYGKNIITFNPIHLIASDFVGVGFSYERIVNDYLGINTPVMIGMNNNYVNVGVEAKLYPAKNTGAVRYAIAPTLMVGIGTSNTEFYTLNPQTGGYDYYYQKENSNHFGFLLNQTVNITITNQFFLGLDGGLGLNYFDQKAKNEGNRNNLSFLAQLHASIGLRF